MLAVVPIEMPYYYAVRIGRTPGVYNTWKECEAQVSGFPGASLKKCSTEEDAIAFVDGVPSRTDPRANNSDFAMGNATEPNSAKPAFAKSSATKSNRVDVYTDGSHRPLDGYLGYGAYCEYQGLHYQLSQTCTPQFLKDFGITSSNCSNPTAELLGFWAALSHFQSLAGYHITFHIDYVGVKHWIERAWKAKKPYIQLIRDLCLKIMSRMKSSVEIAYVPAHSGVPGNERADALAGSTEDLDTFSDLIRVLSKE